MPRLQGYGKEGIPDPAAKKATREVDFGGQGAGATTRTNPFKSRVDSRPLPTDNRPGATRPSKKM